MMLFFTTECDRHQHLRDYSKKNENILIRFLLFLFCRMSVLRTLALLTIGVTAALAQRRLALPDPRSCANRKFNCFFFSF